MSIYTTPLQIGYFGGIMFAILFWYRSYKEERHSDLFLGFVIFFLAMQLQDYTFGFAGINVLWEEMNGFPRYFTLAFAPTVYFYLKAQVDRGFRFRFNDFVHFIPYFVYVILSIVIFAQGSKAVSEYYASPLSYWMGIIEKITIWTIYFYYFYKSLILYYNYRIWAQNQFSNQDTVSFKWLRNFIFLIIAGEIFKQLWYLADYIMNLDFEQDWWWHLFTVAIVLYVGIEGYAQSQPKELVFKGDTQSELKISEWIKNNPDFAISKQSVVKQEGMSDSDISYWKTRIESYMLNEKPYLDPDISLSDLAKRLKTNTSVLSAAINKNFGKNYNDFVNEYRVNEFIYQAGLNENKNLTLIAIAYDCGFNSKATFNRAVKKIKGISPSELVLV